MAYYDIAPYEGLVSFSDYDSHVDYDYSCSSASPQIDYFAYNRVESRMIAYEPVLCRTGYVSYHSQYLTKDLGFNEPEYEVYDPTPYGGGYDIISTYGHPLPPSKETCYPHSTPDPTDPTVQPIEPKSKPEPMSEPTPEPVLLSEPEPMGVPVPRSEPEPSEPVTVPVLEPEPERLELGYGYDYPWPEYDHGYGYDIGRGGLGYGRQVVPPVAPCEYNPDVVEFCESFFGEWPCLARIRKQQQRRVDDDNPRIGNQEIRQHDPWEACANYIFGGSNDDGSVFMDP